MSRQRVIRLNQELWAVVADGLVYPFISWQAAFKSALTPHPIRVSIGPLADVLSRYPEAAERERTRS